MELYIQEFEFRNIVERGIINVYNEKGSRASLGYLKNNINQLEKEGWDLMEYKRIFNKIMVDSTQSLDLISRLYLNA